MDAHVIAIASVKMHMDVLFGTKIVPDIRRDGIRAHETGGERNVPFRVRNGCHDDHMRLGKESSNARGSGS